MGSTKIKRILNQDISGTTKPKLRVCAYCRVSSKSEEQLTSYEHRLQYIQKRFLRSQAGSLQGSTPTEELLRQ